MSEPLAIQPIYFTLESNSIIPLYKGTISLEKESETQNLEGEIRMEWLPTPAIQFQLTSTGIDHNLLEFISENRTFNLSIPGCQKKITTRRTNSSVSTNEGIQNLLIKGKIAEPLITGVSKKLSCLVFHLPNFSDTLGTGIQNKEQTRSWLGRFILRTDEYKISVDRVEESHKLIDSLKQSGGYGITHVAKLERNDGQVFDFDQVTPIMDAFFHFASFARGFWVTPVLKVGFDDQGKSIWQEWSNPKLESWRNVKTWFEPQNPEILSELWPKFYKLFLDEQWSETLKLAIYWYIAANTQAGGMEGAIVLAQTGHELLSWTTFVGEHQLTPDGFDKLPASDKLRLLLAKALIPLSIPTSLIELTRLAKKLNWSDGPHAITQIRNKFVHPTPKNIGSYAELTRKVLFEAHHLSLWYLELLILAKFKYNDQYVNRLKFNRWTGETEFVPWIK